MYYGSTKPATDGEIKLSNWKTQLLKTLLFFIPRANKDNEKYYHLVNSWWLEIDDQGYPIREIGLDSEGIPLFSAPNDRNFGFWTDSEKVFKQIEIDTIDKEKFEEAWKNLRNK